MSLEIVEQISIALGKVFSMSLQEGLVYLEEEIKHHIIVFLIFYKNKSEA